MNYVDNIKKKMVELDKSVKPKIIAKRFEKIAREHAGGLSAEQQVLIGTIVEIFSS